MSGNVDRLFGAVDAAQSTLQNIAKQERELPLSVQLAQNFNKLLELSKQAMPHVPEAYWPSQIGIEIHGVTANYIDAEIFYKQLKNILAEELSAFSGVISRN